MPLFARSVGVLAVLLIGPACTTLEGFSSGGEPGTDAGTTAESVSASDASASSSSSSSGSASSSGAPAPTAGPLKLAGPPATSTLEGTEARTSVTTTTQVGDLLVVAAYWTYGTLAPGGSPKLKVTDSLGHAFVAATQAFDNYQKPSNTHCKAVTQIFYAANLKGGADTITVTTDQPGNTTFGFTALEYVGASTTTPLDDQVGLATPPGGTSLMSSPALTLSGPRDVVVAVFTDTAGGGQMVPGTGFNLRGSNGALYAMVQDNLPGTTGATSVVATATLPNGATDACWSVAAAAFRSP